MACSARADVARLDRSWRLPRGSKGRPGVAGTEAQPYRHRGSDIAARRHTICRHSDDTIAAHYQRAAPGPEDEKRPRRRDRRLPGHTDTAVLADVAARLATPLAPKSPTISATSSARCSARCRSWSDRTDRLAPGIPEITGAWPANYLPPNRPTSVGRSAGTSLRSPATSARAEQSHLVGIVATPLREMTQLDIIGANAPREPQEARRLADIAGSFGEMPGPRSRRLQSPRPTRRLPPRLECFDAAGQHGCPLGDVVLVVVRCRHTKYGASGPLS